MIDLEYLETLAKAATLGPWEQYACYDIVDNKGLIIAQGMPKGRCEDFTYIAAANPATVLELIAMCRLPWTTAKPTQDGAYWYRRHAGEKLLAHIDDEMVTLLDMPGQEHVTFFDGEWAGPLPEPQESAS